MVGRNTPKNYFPKVYDYCKNKNSFVSECNTTGRWEFDFTRTFGSEEMQEWGELLDKLKDVTLGWRKIVIWKLERSGHFTTRSLYMWMSFRGMKNKRAEKIWRSKLPMKLKVFLWLTIQDRLPTKTKMKERKWKGEQGCTICGESEPSIIYCSHALWHVSPRHASKKPLAGIEYKQTRGTSPRFGSRWGRGSTNTTVHFCFRFLGALECEEQVFY